MNTPEFLPLEQLKLSEHNARQDVPDGDTDAMAHSLWSCGLLQPLIGYKENASDPYVGIVAGGRRLRGLKLLATNGWKIDPDGDANAAIDPIDPIPVLIAPHLQAALAWSSAENEARRALHPADEVLQYRQMNAAGLTPSIIARSCGVDISHVNKRLKLASLPDAALDALRQDDISPEMAKALTYAKDDDTCLTMLANVAGKNLHPSSVKHDLTQGRTRSTNRIVKFVGLDTYIDAGGSTDEDLFEGGAWLTDNALLQKLFTDKLQLAANDERETRGWAWTKWITDAWLDYKSHADMQYVSVTPMDLPDADQKELDDLHYRADSEELTDAEHERMSELYDRAEGDWTDADRARCGAFVYVDNDGDLIVSGAWLDSDTAPATDADTTSDDGDDANTTTRVPDEPAKDPFPQNLQLDMSVIRLHALQRKAASKHDLMLDLLAFSLQPERSPAKRPLAIDAPSITNHPEKQDGFTPDKRLKSEGQPDFGEDAVAAFAAFQDKGIKHRNELLTQALARQLVSSPEREPMLALLADRLKPALRDTWGPTAAFFKRIQSIDYLRDLWFDLTDQDRDGTDGKAVLAKTKTDLAQSLDDLFNDLSIREAMGLSRDQTTRIDTWVPAQMQFQTVGGVG